MEKVTDWIQLWRDLVEHQSPEPERAAKPKGFHAANNRRWGKPDSTRDFVVAQLDSVPNATVLDIGAGTGTWAVVFAQHARRVTAVDSSPAMIEALKANLSAANITNVEIIAGSWPDIAVEPHDFSFCSHGMYGTPDLPAFIRRMEQVTRRTCFLVLRASTPDGVMADAARRIWGHPYDSPNFQVCYKALLQMGISPNVHMADSGLWSPWKNASLEEALAEIKRRFGLVGGEHDEFLTDLLRRRLTLIDGQYVWPRGVRSVLVYWNARQ
ncbi:MAG: methyltransferase domain-containing protein [Chloroflexi bacterium]|nr:methyltransferase domain-containing protein [Chloroflexota bacterium]